MPGPGNQGGRQNNWRGEGDSKLQAVNQQARIINKSINEEVVEETKEKESEARGGGHTKTNAIPTKNVQDISWTMFQDHLHSSYQGDKVGLIFKINQNFNNLLKYSQFLLPEGPILSNSNLALTLVKPCHRKNKKKKKRNNH